MYELPMFPLEHTVLPTALIPLHIFEPRYRALAKVVTARTEPEFGIAMIERGREVGGGEERSSIGVVARIVQSEEFPDGRWGLVAAATRRIRIAEWLPDDPFPRATVSDWPDTDADTYRDTIDTLTVTSLVRGLARIRSAAARLDPQHPPSEPELADDPAVATWQAAVAAGLGPLDAMEVLRRDSATDRATTAARLIAERADVLEALADQGG